MTTLPGTNPPDQGMTNLSIPAKYTGLLPITELATAAQNPGPNATFDEAFYLSLTPMQLLLALNGWYLATNLPGGNYQGKNWYNPAVLAQLLMDALAEGPMYPFVGQAIDPYSFMAINEGEGNTWVWDAQHQQNYAPNATTNGAMPTTGALLISKDPTNFPAHIIPPPVPSPATTCPIGRYIFPGGSLYAHLAGDTSQPGQVWPATGTATAKGVGYGGVDVTGQWKLVTFGQSDAAQPGQLPTAWEQIA